MAKSRATSRAPSITSATRDELIPGDLSEDGDFDDDDQTSRYTKGIAAGTSAKSNTSAHRARRREPTAAEVEDIIGRDKARDTEARSVTDGGPSTRSANVDIEFYKMPKPEPQDPSKHTGTSHKTRYIDPAHLAVPAPPGSYYGNNHLPYPPTDEEDLHDTGKRGTDDEASDRASQKAASRLDDSPYLPVPTQTHSTMANGRLPPNPVSDADESEEETRDPRFPRERPSDQQTVTVHEDGDRRIIRYQADGKGIHPISDREYRRSTRSDSSSPPRRSYTQTLLDRIRQLESAQSVTTEEFQKALYRQQQQIDHLRAVLDDATKAIYQDLRIIGEVKRENRAYKQINESSRELIENLRSQLELASTNSAARGHLSQEARQHCSAGMSELEDRMRHLEGSINALSEHVMGPRHLRTELSQHGMRHQVDGRRLPPRDEYRDPQGYPEKGSISNLRDRFARPIDPSRQIHFSQPAPSHEYRGHPDSSYPHQRPASHAPDSRSYEGHRMTTQPSAADTPPSYYDTDYEDDPRGRRRRPDAASAYERRR